MSEILVPHPLTARRACTPPPPAFGEGGGHTRWGLERGWGVNSSEDARHCSVFYICKYFVGIPNWLIEKARETVRGRAGDDLILWQGTLFLNDTAHEDEKMTFNDCVGDRRSEVLGPEARGGRLERGGQTTRHLHSGRPSKESLFSSGQHCHRLCYGLKGP